MSQVIERAREARRICYEDLKPDIAIREHPPNELHAMAQAEATEMLAAARRWTGWPRHSTDAVSNMPRLTDKTVADSVYAHAMVEAGYVTDSDGLPLDPCPFCGHRWG